MLRRRKIGILILTFFVTGTIVGSGVYMLPAALAGFGSIGLLSWITTAVGAVFLALVFAKMGTLMPLTGGPYSYANAEFGSFIGFQTAYCYWFAAWIGNVSLIPPTIGYLTVFFPSAIHYHVCIGLGLLWLFAVVNLFGVRKAGIVGVITTIFKFFPILLIAAIGWIRFHPDYLINNFNVSHKSGISAFTIAAALTLWSFIGVESATVPAGSILNPKRTIPIATITGTLIAAVTYILTCTAIMGMIPMHILAHSNSPFADAGRILLGKWGVYLIAFGALFSLIGGINAWTLLETQVAMAASHDGLFPKLFGYKNRYDVPAWGIIVTTLLASVLLVFTSSMSIIKQFEIFILAATTMAVIPYLYTSVAEVTYIYRNKSSVSGHKINIFIAIAGALFSLFAIMSSSKDVIYFVMLLLLGSIPLYGIVMCQKKNIDSA